MALTDNFIAVLAGNALLYWFLYNHPVRWKRMIGCFAIMIVGVGYGAVADTVPMAILMWTNIMLGGLKFLEDVGSVIGIIK